jgi:hypothetical protein
LNESLILSYIIPRPKHFFEALRNKSPLLKTNLHNHFTRYSKILFDEKFITEKEFRDILNPEGLEHYLDTISNLLSER